MLTAEKESGQVKAHNYWSERRYGPILLKFLSEHRAALEPSKIHRHREHPGMGRRRSTNPQFGRSAPQLESQASQSSEQPYVIVRRFTLFNENEPFARMREITQLQYSNWPDFGAPAHPAHLLGLVEQCDAVARASRTGSPTGTVPEDTRPILVHCSAGCGRTGTFCTVDTVIDLLKRQRMETGRLTRQITPMDIDEPFPNFTKSSDGTFNPSDSDDKTWINRDDVDLIERTVEDFRLQRLSMVQSLRQFVLCYESILEWLAEQTPKSA
jgi:protein tyrosine phosphatase